jgi:mannitol/fructose-specific phosphotransferase system IIA component (Ntr-type)
MRLTEYLQRDGIVYLKQRKKSAAISELVENTCSLYPTLDCRTVLQAVQEREGVVSSWVAPGIAIPHARLSSLPEFILTIGISREGIEYESADGGLVHLLVLILGEDRRADQHILLLAEVARTFRSDYVRKAVLSATSPEGVFRILQHPRALSGSILPSAASAVNRIILAHALDLAAELEAQALLLHADALPDLQILNSFQTDTTILLVTTKSDTGGGDLRLQHRIIRLPFSGPNRANQVDLALILSLGHKYLGRTDRVISLFGHPDSGILDSLKIVDLAKELPTFLATYSADLLADVAPEVLERMLQIATSIAKEGREGKAIGTIFVLGDYERVKILCRQLVINPFKGYKAEERSILDPSLEETIKEFATIDGAFLIDGKGVVEAAGTYLRPEVEAAELPSGLGARHAAAAGSTTATRAMAVVVSQSTGRVSLFKGGRTILVLDRPS